MGKFRNTKQSLEELKYQYGAVNNKKLRLTLITMADRYSAAIRQVIYDTYNDNELNAIYRAIRASGVYDHGTKDKTRRLVVKYPNPYVYDFIKTVMVNLYGPDWMDNKKLLRHELIRPWMVVSKF